MNKLLSKILILFVVNLMSCKVATKANNKNNNLPSIFSYNILSYDSLSYQLLTSESFTLISENKIQIKQDYIISENKYLIDRNLKINYTKYNLSSLDFSTQYRDKLEVLGKTYLIDSLFYGTDFTQDSEPRTSALNAVYKFTFSGKKYLCFYIQDITNPDAMLNTDILLFDITVNSRSKLLLHTYQASENLKCFGDFNKNNKLDFASWSYGNSFKDTLKMYEFDLNQDEFKLVKDYYLVINELKQDYIVDLKRSNWFSNSPLK